MTETTLPKNVYRLAQKEFDAIPGSPWVYWVSANLRKIFIDVDKFDQHAKILIGCFTCDNFRFIRYWWEVGINNINNVRSRELLRKGINPGWIMYMKGGSAKWFGNHDFVVKYYDNGEEIRQRRLLTNQSYTLPGEDYYLEPGIVFSHVSTGLNTRFLPPGFIFDVASSGIFPDANYSFLTILAILKSDLVKFFIHLINPTINIQANDIRRLPIIPEVREIEAPAIFLVQSDILFESYREEKINFILPSSWKKGSEDWSLLNGRVEDIEIQINDQIYNKYEIPRNERLTIKNDLAGVVFEESSSQSTDDEDFEQLERPITPEELTARWISYAVGIVLGRFQPGVAGSLGSGFYRSDDFAIGSLPPPSEAEFDELVSPEERFAYVDENSGRHIFSRDVEKALHSLALPDGIAVFDEGHPRDLPALVEKALNLMLGEQATREVTREATGVDSSTTLSASLRKFLEKDFFTGWHVKWYRKRPVYWPIQSGKRSYGFVIFHEKITHDTLYTIQREPYLDTKRNAVAHKMADIQASIARTTGTARKKLEKELDDLRKFSDELAEFAKDLDAITLGGYEPEPNWIDDGVILRMAPLWKVIPIWKSEPKKYWERLDAGDYDWSRIAMNYWPERVREKCETNKSFAIAHGHEEWYEG
jgi:hypothetical protein